MVAFTLGPITIYRYGLMFLANFVAGYLFLRFIGKKGRMKHMPRVHYVLTEKLDDFVLAMILGIILGSRLGEVLIYEPAYYFSNPLKIFYVWEGGMAFFGGILGILVAMWLFMRKNKITINDGLGLFDIITTFSPFGIMLGRYVNFLNQELYGIPVPENAWGLSQGVVNLLTSMNFFYVYENIDSLLRVNTNFFALVTEGLALAIIMSLFFALRYKKGLMKPGSLVGIFIIGYAIFRFLLDFLRTDAQGQMLVGLSITQRLSIILVVLGIWFLCRKVDNKNSI